MKRGKAHQEALDALLGLFQCQAYTQPDEVPVRYFTGGHGNIEEAADVLVAAKMLTPVRQGYVLPDPVVTGGDA